MKQHCFFFVVLLLLLATASSAQSINVETERFRWIKKLEVQSFNGCCAAKGYRAVYLFDSVGRVIKSYNYFKRRLLAAYDYQYNEQGLLSEKKSVYSRNKKSTKATTKYSYQYDEKGRVINKTEYFGSNVHFTLYTDFDSLNNANTIARIYNENTFLDKKKYDSIGQLILTQTWNNDTLTYTEEMKYNAFGDVVYSNIPNLKDQETGKMILVLGGNRHWYAEEYVYTYDKQNRWVEKYVVYNNKKVLHEKRIYK